MTMTKKEVEGQFSGLLSAWRALPENEGTDEQKMEFSAFYDWLLANNPQATGFRSVQGARADLEMWFDRATRQGWRN